MCMYVCVVDFLSVCPFRDYDMTVSLQSGLILSEDEWSADWSYLLRQSSAKPRSTPGSTSSCCDSPATKGYVSVSAPVMWCD